MALNGGLWASWAGVVGTGRRNGRGQRQGGLGSRVEAGRVGEGESRGEVELKVVTGVRGLGAERS